MEIKSPQDVKDFFAYLVKERGVNLHPDDDFADYICYETKEPTFTPAEAERYNKAMEDCFAVCERDKADVYELAAEVLRPYYTLS